MTKILNNNTVKILFLLIMTTLLCFSFFDYSYTNERRIEDNLKSLVEENNQQTNISVSDKLEDQIAILQSYAKIIAYFDDITSDAAFEELASLQDTEFFIRVAVTNAEGISYTSDHFQHDSTQRAYYIEGKKGNSYISNVMESMIDQSQVIIMSVPIYKDQQFAGVLRATMDINELNEYFELSFLSGNVSSYLIQSDGLNLITKKNFFDTLKQGNNSNDIIEAMQNDLEKKQKGSITFQLEDNTRYAYYSPIANADWYMLTILPQTTVQDEMEYNLKQTLLLAVKITSILLLIYIYFFYLHYRGSQEVKKMNKQMDAIISNTPGSSYKHEVTKPESIQFFKQDDRLIAGYTKEEINALIKKDIYALISTEDYLLLLDSLQELEPNTVKSNTYRIKNKQNQIQWIFDQRQIINEENKSSYYVEVLDITEMKNVQEQLMISEERYQMILKETESVIFEWNTYTDQISFSDLWTSKYGYPNRLDDFLGFTSKYFEQRENSYIPLIESMVAGKVISDQIECILPKANGEEVWVKIFAKAILNDQGYLLRIVGSISDISQEKQASIQLLERAQKDGLTMTYNRVTLEKLITQEIEKHPEQCHIMFVMDIDNFKLINDTLGHSCGDEALRKFSSALISNFRENDIVGRLGGDEFSVFMRYPNEHTSEQIESKCRSFLMAISKISLSKNESHRIQCSIGIATYPADGKTYQQLYECADRRMYEAKNRGKNTFIYKD